MTRMPLLDVESTDGPVKSALQGIARKRGYVPTPLQVMAHSPATLAGYLGLASAMASGTFEAAMRERIALAVSQFNTCEPCLSAHTKLGGAAGLSADEIAAARRFDSADTTARAVLAFTHAVLATHGHVGEQQFAEARAAGLSNEALVEIVGHVVANQLTNYANSIAKVPAPVG